MKKKQLFLTGCVALLLIILTTGCVMPSNTSTKMTTAEAGFAADEPGRWCRTPRLPGKAVTVTVSYNPTDITYEGQTISDWGTIFGVLSADYPDATTYTIVQMFNGVEVADISASASDVRSLISDKISVSDFKDRLVFTSGNSTASSIAPVTSALPTDNGQSIPAGTTTRAVTGSLVPGPTQTPPSNIMVYLQVDKDAVSHAVTVSIAGGPGLSVVKDVVFRLTRSDGQVLEGTIVLAPDQKINEATLHGTGKQTGWKRSRGTIPENRTR